MAPRIEHTRNNFLGEYLSEMESNANDRVPVINPNCTAEVAIPISSIPTFIAVPKSAMIALPANHNDVPAN